MLEEYNTQYYAAAYAHSPGCAARIKELTTRLKGLRGLTIDLKHECDTAIKHGTVVSRALLERLVDHLARFD